MSVTQDSRWSELESAVAAVLTGIRHGQFLVVEYDISDSLDPLPYAQCAREVDGWYCEVVSQYYLEGARWPIDELALRRAGWLLPDDQTANWWRSADSSTSAACHVLEGLRRGRCCPDPDVVAWSVGTFPSGPDGGEPVPVPSDHVLVPAA